MNEVEIPLKLGGIAAIKAELRDLQGQIANAGDADTMTELAQQAGALKDQIKDANEQVAIFATGSKFEAVSNSFGAIKNDLMSLDFEGASQKAAIFATTLASLKPEDLKKAFTDFKGTLKSVGDGFTSLGKTLMANPMFLIAAVIAAIVAIVVVLMQKLGYRTQSLRL